MGAWYFSYISIPLKLDAKEVAPKSGSSPGGLGPLDISNLELSVRAQLDSGWTWVHRQPYVLNMLGHDGLLIIPWIRPITFNYGANKKAGPMPWAKNKSLNPDVGLASQH